MRPWVPSLGLRMKVGEDRERRGAEKSPSPLELQSDKQNVLSIYRVLLITLKTK